jgi:hypothetical protein
MLFSVVMNASLLNVAVYKSITQLFFLRVLITVKSLPSSIALGS